MADFKQLSYLSIKGLKIRSHTSKKDRLSTIWPPKTAINGIYILTIVLSVYGLKGEAGRMYGSLIY
jgi:hypothetical protein